MDADPHDRAPDTAPDTALATGNDDGEPGDRLGDGTVGPEEWVVLDNLRYSSGDPVVTVAVEDTQAMADAVEDDSVVLGYD